MMNINDEVIPKELWENCPDCDNSGSWPDHSSNCDCDDPYGEKSTCPIQIQCEFCWTNLKSIFYQTRLAEIINSMPEK